eukprot:g63939.t1
MKKKPAKSKARRWLCPYHARANGLCSFYIKKKRRFCLIKQSQLQPKGGTAPWFCHRHQHLPRPTQAYAATGKQALQKRQKVVAECWASQEPQFNLREATARSRGARQVNLIYVAMEQITFR